MKTLLASGLVLVSAGWFQMPSKPPMKMGLWESTSTTTMKMPDMPAGMPGMGGGRTTKVRVCMTPETYEKDLARQQQQRECTISNQSTTANSYSFDISCPRNNATGHFKMTWEGDAGHGTMHMDMNAGGHAMSMDSTMESRYLGADCGSVQPGSPEIVK